ncbi:MAG: capsule assembly Wzi family protein, partial [Bacteroidales bacterium]|nr:capsule assembly Wzi family protein [Bacteroidales bacterium]
MPTVEFRGLYAHGWLEKDRYVKTPYLHHKNVYLRFANEKLFSVVLGIEHFVVWSGLSSNSSIGQLPGTFNDYLRIIAGKEADSSSTLSGEKLNALGNHVASYNIAFKIKFAGSNLIVYKQHLMED